MDTTETQHQEQGCQHVRWMLERLAQHFASEVGGPPYDANALAALLGVTHEDAELLDVLGLVNGESGQGRQYSAAEVLAFLKAHGEAWYRARLAKNVAELEEWAELDRRKAEHLAEQAAAGKGGAPEPT